MKTDDIKKFQDRMTETFAIYQREISKAALRGWWRNFEGYSWSDVEDALNQHEKQSNFFPTPAHIFEILKKNQIREISVGDRQSAGQHQALIATRQILEDLRARSGNPGFALRAIADAKESLGKK